MPVPHRRRRRWVTAAVSVVLGVLGVLLPLGLSGPAHAADDGGRIDARYQALGAEAGVLGPPTSDYYDAGPDGRGRDFANGHIYWSPATDAWEVLAPVSDEYAAQGGPAGYLGFPTGSAAALTTTAGGLEQVFSGGHVYVAPPTGAHAVSGAILTKFLAIGATASYLGYPTADPTPTVDGVVSTFYRGRIDFTAATGALTVTGTWAPSVRRVTPDQVPYTYRSGCPVAPAALRMVAMPYYDWNGVPQFGQLVARSTVVAALQRIFASAFTARFPIRQMLPVDVYLGNDVTSMAHDNTSAFNCRKVTGNPYRISQHSYGNAIDINTLENPYVTKRRIYPTAGRTFLERSWVRKGMILRGGPMAVAMATEHWPWGARWGHPDYQHFSANGG